MTYTRTIQIRLSKDQHNRIKADSIANGFDSVSTYIRYIALGSNRVVESKIGEIHSIITGAVSGKNPKIGKYYPFINM